MDIVSVDAGASAAIDFTLLDEQNLPVPFGSFDTVQVTLANVDRDGDPILDIFDHVELVGQALPTWFRYVDATGTGTVLLTAAQNAIQQTFLTQERHLLTIDAKWTVVGMPQKEKTIEILLRVRSVTEV